MAKMITTTTLVLEHLQRVDDFLTAKQLVIATGRTTNRVTAALHHLRIHKAVEAMDVDGQLYWYHTSTNDDRSRVVEEKHEETRPRKPRKRKSTP